MMVSPATAPPTPPVSALTGAGAGCGRFLSPLPFQKRFLGWAMKPDIALAALSCPRGNGKSWTSHLVLNEVLPGGETPRGWWREHPPRGIDESGESRVWLLTRSASLRAAHRSQMPNVRIAMDG